MKKKFEIYLITILITICLSSIAWSAESIIEKIKQVSENANQNKFSAETEQAEAPKTNRLGNKNVQIDDFESVSRQVAELGQTKNLFGLQELENTVNNKSLSIELYTELMIKVCGAYNTYDFKDKEQYVLARKCTKNALTKLEKMPIGIATKLVAQLGGDSEYILGAVPESDWETDRTERAKFWFRAWQLLDEAIIDDYNFEANRPIYHSKMTVKERSQAEIYNKQRFLHRDKENFSIDFNRFVIKSYTRNPYNTSELKIYLNKYVSDPKVKKDILLEVKAKILSANKDTSQ